MFVIKLDQRVIEGGAFKSDVSLIKYCGIWIDQMDVRNW